MADRNSFRRSDLVDEVPSAGTGSRATLGTRVDLSRLKLCRPQNLRRFLLTLGPVLVLAAGMFVYMTGGRYVSTDNAYVHAGKLTVATDVSGIVANVAVHESQKVEKGDVLFTLDQEPFRIALAGAEANLGSVRNQITTQQATYRQKVAQIEQAKTDVGFYETTAQRQQDLLRRGVSAQATFDQAKRDLDAARERVSMAQHDAEAALAQLGGNANGRIEDTLISLLHKRRSTRRVAISCAPPSWRPIRRHRDQCRCAAGRRVSAGRAGGIQPRLPRPMSGSKQIPRSPISPI